MSFGQWQQHWGSSRESQPSLDEVGWRALPEPDRPLHTHTPADYALDDSTSNNPAKGVALNPVDSDAGLKTEELPALLLTPPPVHEALLSPRHTQSAPLKALR